MLFKGVGRHPKTEKKKGGIKVHTNIHANDGVPSDVRFTSAATNDSLMLKPTNYAEGDTLALGRAYINYGKFEKLTTRGVIYVTKMKKSLVYQTTEDVAYMTPDGLTEYRVKQVSLAKEVSGGDDIVANGLNLCFFKAGSGGKSTFVYICLCQKLIPLIVADCEKI